MAQHFRLSAVARTISLGQALRMVDAEVETTFAPAIWWRLLHKGSVRNNSYVSRGSLPGRSTVRTSLNGSIIARQTLSPEIIGPDRFRTVPMPTYPEIRLAVGAGAKL